MFALMFLMTASSLSASVNLVTNGNFEDGWKGFGFGDGTPEAVGAKLEPIGDGSNALSYRIKPDGWGGLNFSEVPIEKGKVYRLSFAARADKPVQMRLVAFQNGDSIFRQQIDAFNLTDKWQTFSFRISRADANMFSADDWVPFRVDKNPGGEEVEVSFANVKIGIWGEPIAERDFSHSICILPRGKEKKSGKKAVPAENSMIFEKNSEIASRASFNNKTGSAKSVSVSWEITSASSAEKFSGSKKISVPSGKSSFDFSIKAPSKNGVYDVDFFVDSKIADAAVFAVTPVTRAPKGTLPMDLGYCGVITNGERAAPSESEMAFLADTGIAYIRTWDNGNPFNWRVIEPEQGKYNFDVADETLKQAKKQNIEILPVLGGMFFTYPDNAYWREHRQADWLYRKSDITDTIISLAEQGRRAIKPPLSDWERMVQKVAERYRGQIRQYEIMNEPNIIWRDYTVYFPYLKSAHKILKSVDAETTVVGLSTTGDFGGNINGFVGTMLKMGAAKYMDAISFHSYGAVYEDGRLRGNVVIENFKADLKKAGADLPLWNSELYYLNPTSSSGTDHRNGPVFHAGYAIRRYLVDISCGVKVSTIMPGSFVATLYPVDGQKFSRFAKGRIMPHLSRQDFALVPSEKFIVSAVFARQIANSKYFGKELLKDDWLCYKFENKKTGKAVAAIFAMGARTENLDRNFGAPKTKIIDPINRRPLDFGALNEDLKVIDIYGNAIEPAGGSLKIEPSPIPVYVRASDMNTLNMFLGRFK